MINDLAGVPWAARLTSMMHNATVRHPACCACRKPFYGARNAKMCRTCESGEPGRQRKREADARAARRRKARMGSAL